MQLIRFEKALYLNCAVFDMVSKMAKNQMESCFGGPEYYTEFLTKLARIIVNEMKNEDSG